MKSPINRVHLSSKNGTIPAPGPSTQQTAGLILDVDKDGINVIIIGARKVGPALLWFHRLENGWKKYTIEPELIAMEAGGTFHDMDGDGDMDIISIGLYDPKIWLYENKAKD